MGMFSGDGDDKGNNTETPIVKGVTEITEYLTEIGKGADPLGEARDEAARAEIVKGLGDDLPGALSTVTEALAKFTGDEALSWPTDREAFEGETVLAKAFDALVDLDEAEFETEVAKALPDDLKAAIQRVITYLGRIVAGKYPMPAGKGTETDKGGKGKVAKGDPADTDDPPAGATEIDPEALDEALTGILKAKRITPARMKALKDFRKGVDDLLKAFGADDEDEDDEDKNKGKGKAAGKVAKGDPADEGDDAGDGDDDKLDKILKGLDDLKGRVDKIEGARNPSKEPAGDNGDGTKVNKGDGGNVWDGMFRPSAS